MKIYFISSSIELSKEQENRFKSIGDFNIIEARKMKQKEFSRKAKDVEILIAGPSGLDGISKSLLNSLKSLKFISLLTIGTHWVDINAAKQLGIIISNNKGATAESVAEHIWGMILNLSKKISEFDRDIRLKGAYKFTEYLGKEVYKKTIGIIGLGDIGKKVARISNSFDMNTIGINKSGKKVKGVRLVEFEYLLNNSDIITICVPLNEDTINLISNKEFKSMKDSVILVNCAREKIVNKEALIKSIKNGKVFGYGVETEIMQSLKRDDPYLKFPNIIVNAHNAFNTKDSEERTNDLAIKNIEAFINGKPQNVVT